MGMACDSTARILRSVLSAGIGLVSAMAATAAPEAVVSTSRAVQDAFASASPGDRIILRPGQYQGLVLRDGGGSDTQPIIISSADPGAPAELDGLRLNSVRNVVIRDVVLDYRFHETDGLGAKPFVVRDSTNIRLADLVIDGDVAEGVNPTADGYPAGFGLLVAGTNGFELRRSEIRKFWRGVNVRESQGVDVIGNNIHSLRMDGMNFAQVQDVVIAENWIHDFDRILESKDHADMIQFWTAKTTGPTRNVTIRDNLLNSGKGLYTQSIFMRNELVEKGEAGREMFYENVEIRNNLIINAHLHGITLGESAGASIENNTLVHNPGSDGPRDKVGLYRPQVSVAEASTEVRVVDNLAWKFNLESRDGSWKRSRNISIQDKGRLEPYHYSTIFVGGDRSRPESYVARPSGPIAGSGIGANVSYWTD